MLSQHNNTWKSVTPCNYNPAKCMESKFFRFGKNHTLEYPFLYLRPLFVISK
jgi:hypothetical protein